MAKAFIEIQGNLYTGWKRVALDFSMDEIAGSFSFTADDKDNILGDLSEDTECSIQVSDDSEEIFITVLRGYITDIERTISANEHTTVVSGSDYMIDIVECSALPKRRQWVKAKFVKIIKDVLEPFENIKLNYSNINNNPVIDKVALKTGEKAFTFIERLCRSQVILPQNDYNGTLYLTYSADKNQRAGTDLIVGSNVTKLIETRSSTERFSEYIGVAQNHGGGKKWTRDIVQNKITASDRGIARYRPLVFFAETKADRLTLAQRVNWEAQVRAGRSRVITCLTDSWFKDASSLWGINKRTTAIYKQENSVIEEVNSKAWNLEEEQLITGVSFVLNDSGEQTTLLLKHPDVFKQDPSKEIDLK